MPLVLGFGFRGVRKVATENTISTKSNNMITKNVVAAANTYSKYYCYTA